MIPNDALDRGTTRRSFIKTVTAGGLMLALGGVSRPARPRRPMRPVR